MLSRDKCYENQVIKIRENRGREGASTWCKAVRDSLPEKVTSEQSMGPISTPPASSFTAYSSSATTAANRLMQAPAVSLPEDQPP